MRRATSRVSFLMCPFCVRVLLTVPTTGRGLVQEWCEDREDDRRERQRHGWVVVGRRLLSADRSVRIACPDGAASLLPPGLPELFDAAELAQAAGIERRLAEQMSYRLRARRPRNERETRQRDRPPPR